MSFKHLSLIEREKLYGYLERGFSVRKCAKLLSRCHTSLVRELALNTKWGAKYVPCYAQARAERVGDRQRYRAPLKGPQVFLYVREKLRMGWSPETISGRVRLDIPGISITPETIYRYIYSTKTRKARLSKYLCCKHGKRRKQNGRSVHKSSKIPHAVSIDKRAKYIERRKQTGHWESDLVEGSKSSRHVLSVTTERVTRYTIINKLSSKKSADKTRHLVKRMKNLPAQMRRTLTVDNGAENTNHMYLGQQLNISVYFCHPYHSWEKGTVENMNGRIRRYIPKGTDIRQIPAEKISQLEYIVNNTPRKCLGYLTPYERMCEEIGKLSKSS